MKKILCLILLLVACSVGWAQTSVVGGGSFAPLSGSADPNGSVNCNPANTDQTTKLYYRTATAIGWYSCTATNTWTLMGAAGSGLPDPGGNGIVKRTALNTSAVAVQGTDYVGIGAGATFGAFTYSFAGAAHTLPVQVGLAASKPATCTQGEIYFATDATAGQNLYFCSATNTWTQQLNSGGGITNSSASGVIPKTIDVSGNLGTSSLSDSGTAVTSSVPVSAPGFTVSGNPAADGWTAQADPAITTVASLGTATNGLNKIVTDGSSATDCTVGGGSNKVWCQGNGSAWGYKLAATGAIWLSSSVSPNGWRYFNGTAIKDVLTSETAAGSFPTLNQNTSGTASNVSGTPALPNGTTATTQSDSDNSTKLATTAYVDGHAVAIAKIPSSVKIRSITFSFGSPEGSALSTGLTRYVTVPFGCTISAYNLLADAGTFTVKFWKVATGTAIPTVSNSISTSGVSLSTGTALHSTTVTDFTSTAVTANDIMAANITAVATAKFVQAQVECDQ